LGRKGINREQFKGREKDLAKLHELLQSNSQVAITAAVTGMGGIGKSELAIQYAKEHLSTYPGGVCWLPARDFALKLVEFARPRFFPKMVFEGFSLEEQIAYCWQHWAAGEVLLVLDDMTDYQQVQPYLPASPRFKVLITTRERLGKSIAVLDLEVLEPAAALDLLKSLVGKERVAGELQVAGELCAWLGYLPLGLELVGRYLEAEFLSIAEMLQRLQQKRLRHRALMEVDAMMTAQLGVADAFELSWERLDENAQQLGCLLSLFALAPIDWELVEQVVQRWQFARRKKFIYFLWKLVEKVFQFRRGKVLEIEDLEQSRRDLVKLHLLKMERSPQTPLKKGGLEENPIFTGELNVLFVSQHSLLREFFQEKLQHPAYQDCIAREMHQAFAAAMAAVAKQIPDTFSLEQIEPFLSSIRHLEQATINERLTHLQDEDLAWIFTGVGRFYHGQGLYQLAFFHHQNCLIATKARFGDRHPDVAISLNNLASLYELMGNYSQAEPLYVQALNLMKELLGERHLDVATSLNNLASLYYKIGNYTQATGLLLKALNLRQELLGDRHRDVAQNLNNLALLYYAIGNYSQAEPLYAQALNLRKELLGERHPDVAQSLNNLALLYYAIGNYSQAEPLYVEALNLRKELLGERHPDVAQSLNNLAALYYTIGKYSEAEPLYVQALNLRQELLGDRHPLVATSLNNLAGLYRSIGKYSEAEPLYVQALEICEERLGEEHPNTITVWTNLEYCRAQGGEG